MSEIITVSPVLHTAVKIQKEKKECLHSYLEAVTALSRLPEDALVEGALEYAKHLKGAPDITGNTWLQALSMKDEELARSVQEMIEQNNFE